MWSKISCAALLFGLLLTAIGAAVTAKAVIITDDQAKQLGTTMWGSNPDFIASLKVQSQDAQHGLYLIVAGTILQMIGTVIPRRK